MALYSDLNQTNPTTQPVLTGVDAIYQSIDNILSTPTRTRLFNMPFATDIEALLFDPMDETTVAKIYDSVIEAILKWDSRVGINYSQSQVIPVYEDNRYDILLIFKISGIEDELEYHGELIRP